MNNAQRLMLEELARERKASSSKNVRSLDHQRRRRRLADDVAPAPAPLIRKRLRSSTASGQSFSSGTTSKPNVVKAGHVLLLAALRGF
jgi:acyl-coenzyme A synthetase/AMP-(fatty) acid ligase